MAIEQEIDRKLKEWIGDLTVQNIARQARIDELLMQLAQMQGQLSQIEGKLAQMSGVVGAPPPEPFVEHKTNGAG